MSATDAATYPKGATLLETINNPSKARKSVLVLKQQLPR
jgi:hypothetical protein